MRNIKTITVVGANGTMGSNICGIFAAFGNAKVYMVSRDIEKSQEAALKAVKSVRAASIVDNLIPASYDMLDKCVKESDLIFESVAEDLEIKLSITKQIAKSLRNDAIVCTGTSGLSITTISQTLPESVQDRYLGIHFYNPPYNLTLCEVIPTQNTDKQLLNEVKTYLSDILFRTVVEMKDCPAFIGNRIGFYFINNALQFAEKYKHSGGIDYIDAILGPFTGRSMAPLVTSDFVGLDICKAIIDNIYDNTQDYAHEAFILPDFVKKLINQGSFGRKTNGGLYKIETHDNGVKSRQVYNIITNMYRDKTCYGFPFVEQMISQFEIGNYKSAFEVLINDSTVEAKICMEFLLQYVVYALYISINVGHDIMAADDVMAMGFHWCPPLALVDAFSEITDFEELLMERLPKSILEQVKMENILGKIKPSKYDYRPYFKAIK